MKKALLKISLFIMAVLLLLGSCVACFNSNNGDNIVPTSSIRYTNFYMGNVIDDGKRAVYINFVSDYKVTKIEGAGKLLDQNGNQIYEFDTSLNFSSPTKSPKLIISVEANFIKKIKSVSFTKIKAYTKEAIS